MRMIPKKINVKNTVWKCYSMTDVFVALVLVIIIFLVVNAGSWILAILLLLASVVLFMPTPDGVFYSYLFSIIKFLFGKKKFVRTLDVRTTGVRTNVRDRKSVV